MKKHKVVHLTSVHRPDDVRIYLKECRSLSHAGYKVNLVVPASARKSVEGITFTPIPIPKSRKDRMLNTTRAIYQAALSSDGDIYHFHDPELMPVGMLLKVKGKRVIYDVHEELSHDILDKSWMPSWIRPLVASGAEIFEKSASKFYDGIIVSRPSLFDRFPKHKTVLVHNYPILGELMTSKAIPFTSRPKIGAYLGGLSAERGLRQIIDALAQLPDSCDFTLHVAGTISPPQLEKELKHLPGWHRIRLLGWQSRNKVAELLNTARFGIVMFLPIANHLQSEPTKIFEYLSSGLPIVAADLPHWRKIVSSNDFGLLADPFDPKAIAYSILWMLDHPEEAEEMGKLGITAVREKFNWDHEKVKLLALYDKILTNTKSI
jgi:glycosyltransferase involved in cell wall biosynthesis